MDWYRTSYLTVMSVVLAALASGSAWAQVDDDLDALTLEGLVSEALDNYPEIEAAWFEVDALEARDEQVSQPFDPMVTLGIMNVPVDSFRFDMNGMTGIQIGIQERFYWPGVLDAREAEAQAMADTRRSAIPELSIRIWNRATMPFFRLVALDRAANVLRQRQAILETLQDAARARYEARAVPLSDVYRVETQISRIEQELLRVARDRSIAQAEFNGLLQRSADAPVETAGVDDVRTVDRGEQYWLERAIAQRPAFAHLDAREDLLGAQERSAEASDDPVWNLGMAYAARFQDAPVGSDLLSLTMGINLPFFSANRADARLDELGALRMGVDADRRELIRRLRADIGTRLEALRSLESEIGALDGDLIPAVEDTYESALAHYSSSHSSVETLMEIQDRLLELDLARAGLVSAHDMQRALLRALVADSEVIRTIAWSER